MRRISANLHPYHLVSNFSAGLWDTMGEHAVDYVDSKLFPIVDGLEDSCDLELMCLGECPSGAGSVVAHFERIVREGTITRLR